MEQVPYKIYRANANSRYDLIPDMSMTNSSYANSQMQQGSVQDFMTDYNANKSYYDDYFSRNTTPGIKEAFQQIISGGANTAPIQSGYVIDPVTGNLSTQSAINSQAANLAGVANGTLREISPGMYVPVGSAADYNQQGMGYEQQLQQPSVQQQIQQQGLTPVNPNSQTPTPAGAPPASSVGQGIQPLNQPVAPVAPTFDQALFQEYRNRPDLQALYNQDGSAKNPNDPRLAGIPTLQEWAMKYGVNESALLKGASPAPSSIPTTPVSLNPSTQVSSSLLTGGKTMSDVQGLIEGNSKKYGDIRDQILKAMMPSQVEMDLEKRLNDIEALSRNINLSAQAGINKIKDQPVAMQFIVGQAKSVMEDANLQLQTMAAEQASVVDRLGLAQKARQTSLQVLETMYQFQREDEALIREDKKLQQEQEKAAMEFAMEYNVEAPYFQVGKTIFRTSDRKGMTSEKEFFADAGVSSFEEAKAKGLIQTNLMSDAEREAEGADWKYTTIGNDENGAIMGWVNQKTRQIQPVGSNSFNSPANAGGSIASVYPEGSTGPGSGALAGQCAVFTGAITYIPTPGNTLGMNLSDKKKNIDSYGIKADQWVKEGARVGDAIVFSTGQYGHTATVNSVNPDGTVTLSEANFQGDKKVTHTRRVSLNDKSIYGVYRGTLKPNVAPQSTTPEVSPKVDIYAKDVLSGAISLSSVPDKLQTQVSQKVQELRSQSKYGDEWEARVDYDNEIRQLQEAYNNKELASNPSDIIAAAIATYGKFISRQEIEATIQKIFGASRPVSQTTTTQSPTAYRYQDPGFFGNITRNLSEFYNTLTGKG